MNEFQKGSHVYIGAPAPDKVHWVVEHINQASDDHVYATVRSPMSGITQVVPIERLTPHSVQRVVEAA